MVFIREVKTVDSAITVYIPIEKLQALFFVILESPRCTLTPHRGDEESGGWAEER